MNNSLSISNEKIFCFPLAMKAQTIGLYILFLWFTITLLASSNILTAFVAIFCIFFFCSLAFSVFSIFKLTTKDFLPLPIIALPVGLIIASGFAQFFVARSFPLYTLGISLAFIALLGIYPFYREIKKHIDKQIPNGLYIIIIISFVALAYYLPVAFFESVISKDGSYHWMYVDSMFHESIASLIYAEAYPISHPSFSLQTLSYHLGPYALSATIAKLFNLSLGDALARVIRSIGILSCVCSIITFGFTAQKKLERKWKNITIALISFFFLSSLFALVRPTWDSSRLLSMEDDFLYTIFQYLGVFLDPDNYKEHILIGSGLWGMIVLNTVFTILSTEVHAKNIYALIFLISIFGMSLNIIAGLPAFGIIIFSFILFQNKKSVSFYIILILAISCMFFYLTQGGFLSQTSASTFEISSIQILSEKWFKIVLWLTIGLSLKMIIIFLFPMVSKTILYPLIIAFIGYVFAYIFLHDRLWGNEIYALIFLNAIVSLFSSLAFTNLLEMLQTAFADNKKKILQIVSHFGKIIIVLSSINLILFYCNQSGKLIFFLSVFSILLGILLSLSRSSIAERFFDQSYRSVTSLVFIFFIMLSFGCYTKIRDYGWNRIDVSITIDSNVVKSLAQLSQISSPHDIFATNHHSLENIPHKPDRSSTYTALSHRKTLLEGWEYGVAYHYKFQEVKNDNDTLFNTRDSQLARNIINKYNIRFLLIDPQKAFPNYFDEVQWLQLVPHSGSIKIYKVIESV